MFPIVIKIIESGDVKLIKKPNDLPKQVAFIILTTSKDK